MSDFEGLPVALMEAMAHGVVPVARAIASGIPELVRHEHTGLLVSDAPDEAARALLRLANDPALWQRCSTNSQALITQSYSQASSTQQWRHLLSELSQRSRPRAAIHVPGWLPLLGLRAAAIHWLWTWPQRRRFLRGRWQAYSAQLKGRMRELVS